MESQLGVRRDLLDKGATHETATTVPRGKENGTGTADTTVMRYEGTITA